MERYKIKKISEDCVFPDGLWELKDTEGKFFMIFDCEDDAKKLKSCLDKKDKENTILKKALELACESLCQNVDDEEEYYAKLEYTKNFFIEQVKESKI